jgi:hypothetical protein
MIAHDITILIQALEKAIGAGIPQTHSGAYVEPNGEMCVTSAIYWACTGEVPTRFEDDETLGFAGIARELGQAIDIDFFQPYYGAEHLLAWMTRMNDDREWAFAEFLLWFQAELGA